MVDIYLGFAVLVKDNLYPRKAMMNTAPLQPLVVVAPVDPNSTPREGRRTIETRVKPVATHGKFRYRVDFRISSKEGKTPWRPSPIIADDAWSAAKEADELARKGTGFLAAPWTPGPKRNE